MVNNPVVDKKWKKFIHRAKLFNSIPFVDFAFAAGSMAIGNEHEYSDFDVIVGAKKGRIFTARFFAVIFYDLYGWRRKKGHDKNVDKNSVKDKICLSHFVTESTYRFSPPYNEYWHTLYQSLVALTGEEDKIRKFFASNDWLEPERKWISDDKFRPLKKTTIRKFLEWILKGNFGDFVEKKLKDLQVKRIEIGVDDKNNYKPRIIYSDDELEFHPHTYRIELFVENEKRKREM